jgi:disulfide bond formation protein DsbB
MYRKYQGLLFIIVLMMFCMAFYLQYKHNLTPCPLCMVQRFFGLLFAAACVIGWFSLSKKVTLAQLFFSLAGLFFAGRQLWLQSLPLDQVPACLPGFDVLLRYFPWRDVFLALFWGSGECAEVSFLFLGLSIPAWSALSFLMLFLGSAFLRHKSR